MLEMGEGNVKLSYHTDVTIHDSQLLCKNCFSVYHKDNILSLLYLHWCMLHPLPITRGPLDYDVTILKFDHPIRLSTRVCYNNK
jgi:hypothetical protein